MQDALKGNKVYLLAAAYVAFNIGVQYLDGTLTAANAVDFLLDGGLLAAFRAAIAKVS